MMLPECNSKIDLQNFTIGPEMKHFHRLLLTVFSLLLLTQVSGFAQDAVEYKPLVYHDATSTGIGAGKHIVFLAGDHEYRSEETLPAMARILAKHHGFKCTVLFNVNAKGHIEPGNNNMPGMEALDSADLAVVFLRFQNFPEKDMQHFADYIDGGWTGRWFANRNARFQNSKREKVLQLRFQIRRQRFQTGIRAPNPR